MSAREETGAGGQTETGRDPAGVWLLVTLIALCVLPELVIRAAPLWGGAPDRLRRLAEGYFAFWPGLLWDWRPNYPFQSLAMFVTYSLLHTGLWHLGLNMLTLWSLGRALIDDIGQGRLAAVYLVSAVGGGLGYALLGSGTQPMVGASGALFGLAGALIWDQWTQERQLRVLVVPTLLLIAMNVVMYWVMGGWLAWQTHLGGFLAGGLAMMAAMRLGRRSARRPPGA